MPSSHRRTRIIHLAFQDFRQPGSGGGATRTHEINKRLSDRFDIMAYTTNYPGAHRRVEDGVTYIPIGRPWGYFGSILTYFAAIPWTLWHQPADLIVEDFAAPFSSCLSPLFTKKPTVAVVQWLNARDKSRQYHLPFWLIERLGLRLHRRYIAVSQAIAQAIANHQPAAHIEVIANGLNADAFLQPLPQTRQGIVYLGRIEKVQKGLDVLLEAMTEPELADAQLTIIGTGPDEAWLKTAVKNHGLQSRVTSTGRLEGTTKYQMLAAAAVVVMPSRFETFGLVAIEAMACGTPVVASDLPALREVIPEDYGRLVPADDVSRLATALASTLVQATTDMSAGQPDKRRQFARRYDWDELAQQQARCYLKALQTHEAPSE